MKISAGSRERASIGLLYINLVLEAKLFGELKNSLSSKFTIRLSEQEVGIYTASSAVAQSSVTRGPLQWRNCIIPLSGCVFPNSASNVSPLFSPNNRRELFTLTSAASSNNSRCCSEQKKRLEKKLAVVQRERNPETQKGVELTEVLSERV